MREGEKSKTPNSSYTATALDSAILMDLSGRSSSLRDLEDAPTTKMVARFTEGQRGEEAMPAANTKGTQSAGYSNELAGLGYAVPRDAGYVVI